MVAKEDISIDSFNNAQVSVSLDQIKTNFFETNEYLSLTLYVKSVDSDHLNVLFDTNKVVLQFVTNDSDFHHKINNETSTKTIFKCSIDLMHDIVVTKSSFKLNKSTIELKMFKLNNKITWNGVYKATTTTTPQLQPQIPTPPTTTTKLLTETTKTSSNTKENRGRSSNVHLNRSNRSSNDSQSSNSLSPSISPQRPIEKTLTPATTRVRERSSHPGTTGLINFGNTCYLNAALQCLVNTTDLRNYFIGDKKVKLKRLIKKKDIKIHFFYSF
jgi:hypothetical protein